MVAENKAVYAGPEELVADEALNLEALAIYQSYKRSPYFSAKHSSYFQTYEQLFSPYRGRKFTFVEIGVANGGSLLMWRDYFGPDARIIGIDFNPEAKRFEAEGFEIYIGSQSEPEFWETFFEKVRKVDIILDDGGHTNKQQIVTAQQCIPHINDGGMLVVEDTHTSYLELYDNPSRYSFMHYAKKLVDAVNSRFPAVNASNHHLNAAIYSIGFYESIVCFHIDRRKCFVSTQTTNKGQSFKMQDYRDHGTRKLWRYLCRRASQIGLDPWGLKKYFQ